MELRDLILSDPIYAEALAAKDCEELARLASVGRMRLKTTAVGVGAILAVMDNGGQFIDTLVAMGASDRDVYWSRILLERGDLNLGVQKLQDKLSEMAQALPAFAAGIAAFKALGYEPDPYTAQAVAEALFNPDGSPR